MRYRFRIDCLVAMHVYPARSVRLPCGIYYLAGMFYLLNLITLWSNGHCFGVKPPESLVRLYIIVLVVSSGPVLTLKTSRIRKLRLRLSSGQS